MKMTNTKHGKTRGQQRGRTSADISIIGKYGEESSGVRMLTRRRVKHAVLRLRRWMNKHASHRVQKRANQVRALISRLEKLANWMIITTPKGEVITVYLADRRRQRLFMRGGCRPVDGFSQ